MNGDNKCHAQFIVPNPDSPNDEPLIETYDLSELGDHLVPDDYEGYMDTTIVLTGDVIRTEVSFHVTSDGLVDFEAI